MLPTASQIDARRNYILSALSAEDFARVAPELQLFKLRLGEVLYETGDRLEYGHFPITAIVSVVCIMENGGTTEIGLVGNDGMLGISVFMGGGTSLGRAVVQSEGTAVRMRARDLKAEFARGGRFQEMLLRYTEALMRQISQTAVCNRMHTIEQQLCRWVLQHHDRTNTSDITTTHDLIAHSLGVRREGITLAAHKLAAHGLIAISRGSITVLDRPGLEEAVCECYETVNSEYNRLLGLGMSRTFA